MAVPEMVRHPMSLDRRTDHGRGVPPLLLCGGCESWDPATGPPIRGGCVADREDAWAAGHGEIAIDDDTARFVSVLTEPLRGR